MNKGFSAFNMQIKLGLKFAKIVLLYFPHKLDIGLAYATNKGGYIQIDKIPGNHGPNYLPRMSSTTLHNGAWLLCS